MPSKLVGPDTIYLTDSTGDQIEKYSLDVNGTDWDFDGSVTVNDVIGLTGTVTGSGATATVTLYATTSSISNESGQYRL